MKWVKLWNKRCPLYYAEATIEAFSDSKFFPLHTLELLIATKKNKQIALLPENELKKVNKGLEKSYMNKEGFVLFEGYFDEVCSTFVNNINLKNYDLFERYAMFWKAYMDFIAIGYVLELLDILNKEGTKKIRLYSVKQYKRLFERCSKNTEKRIEELFIEIGKKFKLAKSDVSMLLSRELVELFENSEKKADNKTEKNNKQSKEKKELAKSRQKGFLIYYDIKPICLSGKDMQKFVQKNKIVL